MNRVALVGLPGSGVSTLQGRLDVTCRLGDPDWHALAFDIAPRAGQPLGAWLGDNPVDAALLVISCTQGADSRVHDAFSTLTEHGLPVVIVLTHIDVAGSDPDEIMAIAARVLGEDAGLSSDHHVILDDDERPVGFISLIDGAIIEWSTGDATMHEPEEQHIALIAEESQALIESIAMSAGDDQLFADWSSGAELDAGDIGAEYAAQARSGVRHPVLSVGRTPRGLGDAIVLDLLAAMLEG